VYFELEASVIVSFVPLSVPMVNTKKKKLIIQIIRSKNNNNALEKNKMNELNFDELNYLFFCHL
jgi:hypothetical protein